MSTLEKIDSFGDLEAGWHYTEGVRFDPKVLEAAKSLVVKANEVGFEKTDAFPGLNGEVMVTIYHGDLYSEYTVEPDFRVIFCQEEGKKIVADWIEMDMDEAKGMIEFNSKVWTKEDLEKAKAAVPELRALLGAEE